jgi:DnaK suppressor protein
MENASGASEYTGFQRSSAPQRRFGVTTAHRQCPPVRQHKNGAWHKAIAGNTKVRAIAPSFASLIEEASQMTTKRLLTEAEILKMSDKDYMNEDQLAFFKNRLEQLQAEILRNAGQTTENLRETVIVPDPADRATIEEEHALELRTRDRERKLLKKVQQSLARIESGEYGWCEETGEPIGIPRMLARPTATLSLEAQERRELRQKLFGD